MFGLHGINRRPLPNAQTQKHTFRHIIHKYDLKYGNLRGHHRHGYRHHHHHERNNHYKINIKRLEVNVQHNAHTHSINIVVLNTYNGTLASRCYVCLLFCFFLLI